MFSSRFIISLVCLSLCNISALADTLAIEKTARGIEYVTGGISEEEVTLLKSLRKKFSLNLIFSEGTSGRYATPVNLKVYDKDGSLIFRKVDSQPRLMITLPAGNYTLVASYNGEKLRHKCILDPQAPQTIILNWKADSEQERADKDE